MLVHCKQNSQHPAGTQLQGQPMQAAAGAPEERLREPVEADPVAMRPASISGGSPPSATPHEISFDLPGGMTIILHARRRIAVGPCLQSPIASHACTHSA